MKNHFERNLQSGPSAVAARRSGGNRVAIIAGEWSDVDGTVTPISTYAVCTPISVPTFGMKHDTKRPEEAPSG